MATEQETEIVEVQAADENQNKDLQVYEPKLVELALKKGINLERVRPQIDYLMEAGFTDKHLSEVLDVVASNCSRPRINMKAKHFLDAVKSAYNEGHLSSRVHSYRAFQDFVEGLSEVEDFRTLVKNEYGVGLTYASSFRLYEELGEERAKAMIESVTAGRDVNPRMINRTLMTLLNDAKKREVQVEAILEMNGL